MIGIALIGASRFMNTQHVPAIKASGQFEIKAVYSRRQESAKETIDIIGHPVDLYADDLGENKSLADLLKREDISAVAIALPISVQADIVVKCLQHNKHVLSEKPIAKDIATAKSMMEIYESLRDTHSGLIWAVAEQHRFVPLHLEAKRLMNEKLGDISFFELTVTSVVDSDHPSFKSPWRKVPDYQGGFLLDGGVHALALLRLLVCSNTDFDSLYSSVRQIQPYLPPADTLVSKVDLKNGVSGTVTLSWGAAVRRLSLNVYGANGMLHVDGSNSVTFYPKESSLRSAPKPTPEVVTVTPKYEFQDAVLAEYQSFAESIQSGTIDEKLSPKEALADIAFIELSINSSDNHSPVKFTY
ncbi:hypothetical protein CANCADRAFT_2261 [Tortispora caseinolytica NRRL Y-17796]|uniref:Gfo/Idh/MocA-like oxidoreductase N-terminal domain-containing protein n=1 Tax=Tortispora caseinolytica NRRL Y-17796 TaxID=767744 RepID=A0A1E4TFQ4_9ASCO|nr:hypothetical protein CANCADRAFT_2261 [Tortispora caseinolytica NRRL Y-17796]